MLNNLSFDYISERFKKGFITPEQLARYLSLKVITQGQYDELTGENGTEQ